MPEPPPRVTFPGVPPSLGRSVRRATGPLVALGLIGCSLAIDVDRFRGATALDTGPEDLGPLDLGPDGGGEGVEIRPAVVDEGVVTAVELVLDAPLAELPELSAGSGLRILERRLADDRRRVGLLVRVEVDPGLGAEATKQVSLQGGPIATELAVRGHPEATLRGEIDAEALAPRYAALVLEDVRVRGADPVGLRVFGDVTLSGLVDVGANGAEPGPGGCAPGEACPAEGGPGADRMRGTGGGGGGGLGEAGEPGEGPQAGSGGPVAESRAGAGGDGGGDGGGSEGGRGGGGGGRLLLDAGRVLGSGTLRADGGDGGERCESGGGGGGGGGGGRLAVASITTLAGAFTLSAEGGAGGGGMGCGFRGGDGGGGRVYVFAPGAEDLSLEEAAFDDPAVRVRGPAGRAVTVTVDGAPRRLTLDGEGRGGLVLERSARICLVPEAVGVEVGCRRRFVP